MTISLVDTGVLSAFTATQSPVMTLPNSLAINDELLYFSVTNNVQVVTALSGHTQLASTEQSGGTDCGASCFQYTIDGTEMGSITLTNLFSSNESGGLYCAAFRGVDNASPVDASASEVSASSTSKVAPAVSPSVDDCMIVTGICTDPSSGHVQLGTPDTDGTEIIDTEDGNNNAYCGMQYYQQGARTSVALDWTLDFSDNACEFSIALTTDLAVGGGGIEILRRRLEGMT